jgi:putative ABC transport system permease protein
MRFFVDPLRWLEHTALDLKHTARMLVHTPSFTVAAIAALALGIAVNTAMFSVINVVLLKPFSYHESGRIVMFQNTFRNWGRTGSAAPVEFNWWRQQTEAFENISAYAFNVANLTGESFTELITTLQVSADFFRLCGSNALHGRTFTAGDDLSSAPKTVVLAYSFWQQRFGADTGVIGRRITLNGWSHEIIGVLGPDVERAQISEQALLSRDIKINEPPDVYVPFQLDPNSSERGRYFNVAGRLKPGVTLAAADARLQATYQDYARTWPDSSPEAGFGVQRLQDAIVGGVQNSLLILSGAVSFVLLIACANVASLVLARATARKREIAIRAALGAGRGRIVRQLLTESMVLSLVGGALGLAIGYAGMLAVLSLGPGIPRIGAGGSNVGLDWRVLGFTLALSMLTAILCGLFPALQSSRADSGAALKESGNRSGRSVRHNRTRALLVITEVALAVVLMIGASLLIRTFIAIRQVNPGFEAQNVLTMRMLLTGPRFEDAGEATRVIDDGIRRIRALPGVDAAGATCCLPLEDRFYTRVEVAGDAGGPASEGVAGFTLVSVGYFETFRIPVLRGRTFTEPDENGRSVAIINQALAKQFWPNGNPLNGQIILAKKPRQIIGVVGDVRDSALNRDPRPVVYLLSAPFMIAATPWAWVIRTREAPMSLSSAIQKELRDASGGLPVARARTMEEVLSRSTAAGDVNALVLTIFGCSALFLAAIGIYGLMAYSVTQRTQDLGIRMALGAESSQIRNMVALNGLRLAVAGVVCGLAMALGLTRLMAGFLFGVKPWDPQVFFIVPIILAGVALIAAWAPAIRAGRIDPMDALRCE